MTVSVAKSRRIATVREIRASEELDNIFGISRYLLMLFCKIPMKFSKSEIVSCEKKITRVGNKNVTGAVYNVTGWRLMSPGDAYNVTG